LKKQESSDESNTSEQENNSEDEKNPHSPSSSSSLEPHRTSSKPSLDHHNLYGKSSLEPHRTTSASSPAEKLVENLKKEFPTVFSENPGKTTAIVHQIELIHDNPINIPPY